jgi:hypothetical protein
MEYDVIIYTRICVSDYPISHNQNNINNLYYYPSPELQKQVCIFFNIPMGDRLCDQNLILTKNFDISLLFFDDQFISQ